MRLPDRIMFTAGALALAFALGGCESMPNLYGLEDMFSTKKPLPGERRAVFPEGVPGVAQGVPPELLPENRQAAATEGEPTETGSTPAKPEAAAAAKPKPKAQPKKEATRSRPPAEQPTATRQEQAAQPWPAPSRQPQPQQQQQAEQPWPAPTRQQQPAAAPWPDAPQSGTFTR
jgi:hypothetical protein